MAHHAVAQCEDLEIEVARYENKVRSQRRHMRELFGFLGSLAAVTIIGSAVVLAVSPDRAVHALDRVGLRALGTQVRERLAPSADRAYVAPTLAAVAVVPTPKQEATEAPLAAPPALPTPANAERLTSTTPPQGALSPRRAAIQTARAVPHAAPRSDDLSDPYSNVQKVPDPPSPGDYKPSEL